MSCGGPGGGGGECAPLGGAGLRGAGAALLRSRGGRAQPDAAWFCPRRRRGRRALPDMLSFQTCPRGRYHEREAAGETGGGRPPEATTPEAEGKGGRRATKNRSCGSRGSSLKRPPRQPTPRPPWRSRVPATGDWGPERARPTRSLPALGTLPQGKTELYAPAPESLRRNEAPSFPDFGLQPVRQPEFQALAKEMKESWVKAVEKLRDSEIKTSERKLQVFWNA